jgi:hypothetical protein
MNLPVATAVCTVTEGSAVIMSDVNAATGVFCEEMCLTEASFHLKIRAPSD